MFRGLMYFLLPCLMASPVVAKSWVIDSQQTAQEILQNVQDGDHVEVKAGTYTGAWDIDKSISIKAQSGAILDANKHSKAITISADRVYISGLTIKNWGDDIGELDSGVFIEKSASNVVLDTLNLTGSAFGIWVDAADKATIKNCKIEGDLDVRSQDRGNGIHLFNVKNALIEGNEVWHTRDGIYIDTSNNNQLISNYLHDLRYGVHYMYSHDNELHRNITERTRTGYALMQSKRLDVQHNQSINDFNYGILMNYITDSRLKFNKVSMVRQGRNPNTNMAVGETIAGADGKALFIYNSVYNEITENELSQNDLAIHLTGGSTDNKIYNNAFLGNRNQVKYVSNRKQEWSFEGQGNYWSDYLGWDVDKDGLGDSQYIPNNGLDKLLWKFPNARMLFNSPGVLLLRWVEAQFPIFKAPGITDSFPQMHKPISMSNICRSYNRGASRGS